MGMGEVWIGGVHRGAADSVYSPEGKEVSKGGMANRVKIVIKNEDGVVTRMFDVHAAKSGKGPLKSLKRAGYKWAPLKNDVGQEVLVDVKSLWKRLGIPEEEIKAIAKGNQPAEALRKRIEARVKEIAALEQQLVSRIGKNENQAYQGEREYTYPAFAQSVDAIIAKFEDEINPPDMEILQGELDIEKLEDEILEHLDLKLIPEEQQEIVKKFGNFVAANRQKMDQDPEEVTAKFAERLRAKSRLALGPISQSDIKRIADELAPKVLEMQESFKAERTANYEFVDLPGDVVVNAQGIEVNGKEYGWLEEV